MIVLLIVCAYALLSSGYNELQSSFLFSFFFFFFSYMFCQGGTLRIQILELSLEIGAKLQNHAPMCVHSLRMQVSTLCLVMEKNQSYRVVLLFFQRRFTVFYFQFKKIKTLNKSLFVTFYYVNREKNLISIFLKHN